MCIHSNASTSGQWRGLIDLLAPKFHVLAPDSYGSGKSPEWPSAEVIGLRDEVALIAALANPGRVRAMALYEPTLFALVDAAAPPPNEADGIRNAVSGARFALDSGNQNAAAEHFIDYWMGSGSWKQTPENRKTPIAASVVNVRRWAHAVFTEPTPLAAFRTLKVPVLYMMGKNSTPSAKAVARLLTATLPRVELLELDDLGHMGPITHPGPVNEAIARFIQRA